MSLVHVHISFDIIRVFLGSGEIHLLRCLVSTRVWMTAFTLVQMNHTNKETAPEFVLTQHTLSTPKGVPITKNI